MTSRLEFEGKNVEIAIQNACKELNINERNLKHEVISYGSSGIFGLVGTKKARIRVMLPEAIETMAATPVDDELLGLEKADPQIVKEETREGSIAPPEVDLTELANQGKQVLTKILGFMLEAGQIETNIDRNRIGYKISGGNSGILIGKRGQTLAALQYIVEKIINKSANARINIQLDVEGYLESREESLKDLAIKLSKKAKRTGKPVTVGHMSAHERKIIHTTLKDDKKVHTQSMGDGFSKKLVIFPKRRQNTQKNRVSQ